MYRLRNDLLVRFWLLRLLVRLEVEVGLGVGVEGVVEVERMRKDSLVMDINSSNSSRLNSSNRQALSNLNIQGHRKRQCIQGNM